jgi:hypothetical protein
LVRRYPVSTDLLCREVEKEKPGLKRKRLIALFLFSCSLTASAQVRWWGIYDFEVRKGGVDSRAVLNGQPNDFVQLNVGQFQLFMEAELNRNISVTTMLSNTPPKSFELKGLEVHLAYVSFDDLLGNALSISAGKILTPFGRFSKRQLATDNPLIGQPCFYAYQLNASPVTGYLDSAGRADASKQYGDRLTAMYTGGYYVGAEAFGSLFDGLLEYDAAVMNSPLSSSVGDYNLDKDLSFHGRAALHLAIWGTIGASYAEGSFLQPTRTNQYFDSKIAPLNSFNQSTYGLDLLLSYLYYELNAEYIFNRFDSPYIVLQGDYTYTNGIPYGLSLNLDSNELLVDLKLEAPFYPGLYLAMRYDKLTFSDIKDPDIRSSTYGRSIPWDRGASRYAIGLGYKPDHSVLIKLGYEKTDLDIDPKPNLDVAACALVITF